MQGEELLVLMLTSDPIRSRMRRVLVGFSVMVAAAACGTGAVDPHVEPLPPGSSVSAPDGPLVQQLTGAVSDAGAMTHLQALQKIADENGGNRAAGTPGYEASVEYVVGVLRDAGFEVSTPTYEVSGRTTRSRPRQAATSSRRPAPETPTAS